MPAMDAAVNPVRGAVLSHLNEPQRTAATHGRSPLLVIAGAGTGKTTTLAHRVACLIADGVDPAAILLLTFTRRAAAEMLRRVERILAELAESGEIGGPGGFARGTGSAGRRVFGGTFHSTAARLLRRHGRMIGLEADFTILDRSDAEDAINLLRTDLKLNKSDARFPLKGTCLSIYSRCVNTRKRLREVLAESFPWCVDHEEGLDRLFRAYTDRKEAQAVLDYDDLLVFWHALVEEPQTASILRRRFECVLVDEYQDTNSLQAGILNGLCPDGEGLTVVGDDAQAIYSFRAATVRNILDFPRQYPGTTVVALEENYRSTQPVLDAANRVIAHAAERHEKELWSNRGAGPPPLLVGCEDDQEQTDYVVERILEHRETGVELKEQAVLYRASHHSLALEVELSRRNIPYHKYGGLKFIETAHIKDLLAFLRLAENPRDVVSGLRVLLLLPGIGPVRARRLTAMLEDSGGDFRVWNNFEPPSACETEWPEFVQILVHLSARRHKAGDVADEVHRVRMFYTPLLEQRHDRAQSRLRDLEQLEQVATRFPDRAAFLQEITLDPPSSTQDLPADPHLDEDYLILSTIHSAKGLEWEAVYVLHAGDGNIPSDMATESPEQIEEERRLFYVALTRARNHLYVCHPRRYYFHSRRKSDRFGLSQLTRFLPPDAQAAFERCEAFPHATEAEAAASGVTTADVRRRMQSRWGGG